MYNLDEKQIATVKTFINDLPDCTAKGSYEMWDERTKQDGRISPHEMGDFVALSHALPKEFQDFPQAFSIAVKNGTYLEEAEDTIPEGKSIKAKKRKK